MNVALTGAVIIRLKLLFCFRALFLSTNGTGLDVFDGREQGVRLPRLEVDSRAAVGNEPPTGFAPELTPGREDDAVHGRYS